MASRHCAQHTEVPTVVLLHSGESHGGLRSAVPLEVATRIRAARMSTESISDSFGRKVRRENRWCVSLMEREFGKDIGGSRGMKYLMCMLLLGRPVNAGWNRQGVDEQ